ncbi:ZIP family metal transporter [Halobellus clavatus]|jgi:ZIP family zinc transporter|uniref:ZIP family metal transporter n=1 Tax=Halobellus clavatus TaxID=660517 RepID=UPI000B7DE8E4|nr:ZIP family metal transporter [Halobellus clavatus]
MDSRISNVSVINEEENIHILGRLSRVGLLATVVLALLSVVAVVTGTTSAGKLVGISWVAFLAMALGVPLGARTGTESAGALVWGYGLAAGAMVTSAAVFLVPQAIGQHPQWGGFGVAFGLLAGFASHTVGHRLSHMDLPMDRTVAELTAHAFSAGAIIGIIYGNMPELGALLGLAIVSHKGPAGYAAARRLTNNGRDPSILLLPATGVGIAGLLSSMIALPASGLVRGLVFGFAAGVFLHVAMDFLPRCELGSEIHSLLSTSGDAHELLDRLRVHAVASTSIGGLVVLLAWLVIA